jgi:hypothetical protein
MVSVMVYNKGGFQVPNETLSMRWIWVVRGGSEMMYPQTKHKMPKLTGSELRAIIRNQVATNAKR